MVTCPKCNKQLADGSKFCAECGTAISEKRFCTNCGTLIPAEASFCQNCGAALAAGTVSQPIAEESAAEEVSPNVSEVSDVAEESVPEESVDEEPVAEELPSVTEQPEEDTYFVAKTSPVVLPVATAKKPFPVKALLFGLAGVAVLVALVVAACFLFFGGNSQNNYALYMKDGELFFNNLKGGDKSWQVSDDFFTTEISNSTLANIGKNMASLVVMSKDGDYVFYPDEIDYNASGYTLYYRPVDSSEEDAVKIDVDISNYSVNESATVVTYLKGEDDNLYQYDLRSDTKEKIGSNVSGFAISKDGSILYYMTNDSDFYCKKAGEDKEKLVSALDSVEYVTEDFKTVYYVKEGSLYKHALGQDRVKVGNDVYRVLAIYDTGEIYYLTQVTEELVLKDYVVDDMLASDSAMEMPIRPDVPYSWNYLTYEEYLVAYEEYLAAYDAYLLANEAYQAKQDRDYLRSSLDGRKIEYTKNTLYYFNEDKKVLVAEDFVIESNGYMYAQDAAVIVYNARGAFEIAKVNLSEIESVYDVETMINDALAVSSEKFVAISGNVEDIRTETQISALVLSNDGTEIYYIDNVAEGKDYGDLYRIEIADGGCSPAKLYDSDVYRSIYFVDEGKLVYFKDYKNNKGDLYLNGEKVAYDVSSVESYYDKIYFFTDWNSEKNYGTLKCFEDGKVVKIADDIYDWFVLPNGEVLYLYDFSTTYCSGELYLWDDGSAEKLDDDVCCIVRYNNGYDE